MFFFPIIGCLSRNSKMSISYFNLLSIFTFSTPLPSSPPPRLICLCLSAQIHPTFIPVPPLIKKHSVCLCFADRDVWFFQSAGVPSGHASLSTRLTLRWLSSPSHTPAWGCARVCCYMAPSLQRARMIAEVMYRGHKAKRDAGRN